MASGTNLITISAVVAVAIVKLAVTVIVATTADT